MHFLPVLLFFLLSDRCLILEVPYLFERRVVNLLNICLFFRLTHHLLRVLSFGVRGGGRLLLVCHFNRDVDEVVAVVGRRARCLLAKRLLGFDNCNRAILVPKVLLRNFLHFSCARSVF